MMHQSVSQEVISPRMDGDRDMQQLRHSTPELSGKQQRTRKKSVEFGEVWPIADLEERSPVPPSVSFEGSDRKVRILEEGDQQYKRTSKIS